MTLLWTNTAPSNAAAATSTLSRVSTTVAVAHGLAVAGRPIDLAGLDAAAGVLCAQILDLPPQDGASLRPALDELLERLTALASALPGRPQ